MINIRNLRNTLKLSQAGLGAMVGMTRGGIDSRERSEMAGKPCSPDFEGLLLEKIQESDLEGKEEALKLFGIAEPIVEVPPAEEVETPKEVAKPKAEKEKKEKAPKAEKEKKESKKAYTPLKDAGRPQSAQDLVVLRQKLNMSQKQFGSQLGISASLVAQLETQGTEGREELLKAAKKLKALEGVQVRHGRAAVPVDEKAADLLKTLRKEMGLSLKEMGEKLSYSGPMIHWFEAKKRGIPEETKTVLNHLHKTHKK